MTPRPLPAEFFARSPVVVARALLGKVLVRRLRGVDVAAVITETEAYWGERDPGSHAHRGMTPRNAVMFGPAGRLYVYFIYGMYHCANIVTGVDGKASAVLLRGVHLLPPHPLHPAPRTDGPGKLCRALAIDGRLNGTPLVPPRLWLEDRGIRVPRSRVERTTRVGLSAGQELPWRFVVRDAAPLLQRSTGKPPRPRGRARGPEGGWEGAKIS